LVRGDDVVDDLAMWTTAFKNDEVEEEKAGEAVTNDCAQPAEEATRVTGERISLVSLREGEMLKMYFPLGCLKS
jgi:hypothetical protein